MVETFLSFESLSIRKIFPTRFSIRRFSFTQHILSSLATFFSTIKCTDYEESRRYKEYRHQNIVAVEKENSYQKNFRKFFLHSQFKSLKYFSTSNSVFVHSFICFRRYFFFTIFIYTLLSFKFQF